MDVLSVDRRGANDPKLFVEHRMRNEHMLGGVLHSLAEFSDGVAHTAAALKALLHEFARIAIAMSGADVA